MMPALNTLALNANDYDRITMELDEILEPAIEAQTNTRDYPELCKWDSHYVFVYDGLKEGFRRDRHLMDYDAVAVGWTKGRFKLWRSKGHNSYAVALTNTNQAETAPVYGEIYQVPPVVIRSLDWLYSNGFMTRRLRMPIDAIIDKKGTSKQIYAWTYPYLNTYWYSRMDRLEPCDLLTSNNNGKKYYNYMKKYETLGDTA